MSILIRFALEIPIRKGTCSLPQGNESKGELVRREDHETLITISCLTSTCTCRCVSLIMSACHKVIRKSRSCVPQPLMFVTGHHTCAPTTTITSHSMNLRFFFFFFFFFFRSQLFAVGKHVPCMVNRLTAVAHKKYPAGYIFNIRNLYSSLALSRAQPTHTWRSIAYFFFFFLIRACSCSPPPDWVPSAPCKTLSPWLTASTSCLNTHPRMRSLKLSSITRTSGIPWPRAPTIPAIDSPWSSVR